MKKSVDANRAGGYVISSSIKNAQLYGTEGTIKGIAAFDNFYDAKEAALKSKKRVYAVVLWPPMNNRKK